MIDNSDTPDLHPTTEYNGVGDTRDQRPTTDLTVIWGPRAPDESLTRASGGAVATFAQSTLARGTSRTHAIGVLQVMPR